MRLGAVTDIPRRSLLEIRVGCELIYDCPQPTPMMLVLNIHYTANMIASVQPSALLASNLSARRRSVLDLRMGFDIPDRRADHVGGALLSSRASRCSTRGLAKRGLANCPGPMWLPHQESPVCPPTGMRPRA